MSKQTLKLITENEVRWVDLRFTDTHGKEQHVTVPSKEVSEGFFDGPPVSQRSTPVETNITILSANERERKML